MKTYLIGLLAVGIVLGSDRLLLADKPNVDELTGAKPAPERTPEQHKGVYARVCSIRTNRPALQTAKMLIAGLEAARRPDEKRQALGGLSRVGDILALEAVEPCMSDKALKEEAASAAVQIGNFVWSSHPEAVKAAVRKALEVSKNDGLRQRAQEVLERAERRLQETKPKK